MALFDYPAREWAERVYGDLRRFTDMARGGHFTAMEEPELLAQDLRGFFRTCADPAPSGDMDAA